MRRRALLSNSRLPSPILTTLPPRSRVRARGDERMNPTDTFLDQQQAATYCTVRGLPISQHTLSQMRTRGYVGNKGPRALRWGRTVRYTEADLLAWMAERLNQTVAA
jgi:predicted DNA-binding transcriptional regulator AlpA